MQPSLNDPQLHLLRVIFDQGADAASHTLANWLGQETRLTVSELELIDLAQAASVLGPEDTPVTACTMGLSGSMTGLILLVFEDLSGLALVDLLLGHPVGTTTIWGDLEESAAKETTNIVGCSFVNALAAHLPTTIGVGPAATDLQEANRGELVPTPPTFVHEFAGSLLQFALMDQALELDQVLFVRSQFETGKLGLNLRWTLLFIPSRESLHSLAAALSQLKLP